MPTNRSLNRRIRQSLYRLKKEYGAGPLFVYQYQNASVDLQTGQRTIVRNIFEVPKVIVLPARIDRNIVNTISMISANKTFVYGGYHDSRTRMFIIERRDVPTLTELKQDDWFVFDDRKYELKAIQEFEYDTAWVVTAKQLIGDVPEQIYKLNLDHLVDLTQSASNG